MCLYVQLGSLVAGKLYLVCFDLQTTTQDKPHYRILWIIFHTHVPTSTGTCMYIHAHIHVQAQGTQVYRKIKINVKGKGERVIGGGFETFAWTTYVSIDKLRLPI